MENEMEMKMSQYETCISELLKQHEQQLRTKNEKYLSSVSIERDLLECETENIFQEEMDLLEGI